MTDATSTPPPPTLLPPWLLCGRSAHASAKPVYTSGCVQFGDDARLHGIVDLASRHGTHHAQVIVEGPVMTVLVHVNGSFHYMEDDLLCTRSVTDVNKLFDAPARAVLFHDTIEEIVLERLLCTDARRIRVLPRVCFTSVTSTACVPCLVQIEDEEDDTEEARPGAIQLGVDRACAGISRTLYQVSNPSIRFVFQRIDYENYERVSSPKSAASVDAIAHVARSVAPQPYYASAASVDDDEAETVAETVAAAEEEDRCRPMPPAMALRPSDASANRLVVVQRYGRRTRGSFWDRLGLLVLASGWERELLAVYAAGELYSDGQWSLNGFADEALDLFEPPIAVLRRCQHTHEIQLHRRGMARTAVDCDEAHRLVLRHSIVFGWDQHHDEVFHALPAHGKPIAFRLADKVGERALELMRRHTATPAGESAHERALKRLCVALRPSASPSSP